MDWRWRDEGAVYRNSNFEVMKFTDIMYGKTIFAVERSRREGIIWYGDTVSAAIEVADKLNRDLGVNKNDRN